MDTFDPLIGLVNPGENGPVSLRIGKMLLVVRISVPSTFSNGQAPLGKRTFPPFEWVLPFLSQESLSDARKSTGTG